MSTHFVLDRPDGDAPTTAPARAPSARWRQQCGYAVDTHRHAIRNDCTKIALHVASARFAPDRGSQPTAMSAGRPSRPCLLRRGGRTTTVRRARAARPEFWRDAIRARPRVPSMRVRRIETLERSSTTRLLRRIGTRPRRLLPAANADADCPVERRRTTPRASRRLSTRLRPRCAAETAIALIVLPFASPRSPTSRAQYSGDQLCRERRARRQRRGA